MFKVNSLVENLFYNHVLYLLVPFHIISYKSFKMYITKRPLISCKDAKTSLIGLINNIDGMIHNCVGFNSVFFGITWNI